LTRVDRIDLDREREAQDSMAMLRFAPFVRPPRPPFSWNVGPARPPRTVWASIITIVGFVRLCLVRISSAMRVIAAARTPFDRQRRHCQTASQRG
jgi:hypothetical protein